MTTARPFPETAQEPFHDETVPRHPHLQRLRGAAALRGRDLRPGGRGRDPRGHRRRFLPGRAGSAVPADARRRHLLQRGRLGRVVPPQERPCGLHPPVRPHRPVQGRTRREAFAERGVPQSVHRRPERGRAQPRHRQHQCGGARGPALGAEGGQPPIAMDPETLETIGASDFNGKITSRTFTAHPKPDPRYRPPAPPLTAAVDSDWRSPPPSPRSTAAVWNSTPAPARAAPFASSSPHRPRTSDHPDRLSLDFACWLRGVLSVFS